MNKFIFLVLFLIIFVIGCGSAAECAARLYDKNMNVLRSLSAEKPYKMYRAYFVDKLD